MMALEDMVDTYCAAWNAAEAAERNRLLRVAWTADGRYSDPMVQELDRAALVAHIGVLLDRFPGSTIRRTTAVDSHHGGLRFGFVRLDAGGSMMREGVDFCQLGEGGRLHRIIGFFGALQSV
ncbi:nuclear transport factor 2 family protein [Ferrovibrio terrae]|uniref:Nuclear transport factor 2 family protein n=1 Tax=Ferrovibrio terrae TaxID=2594003 RepID=A0A516H1Y5_9PROT|nr:nuclear transport factor 2 family protein [Ferrovibrio terrae]QDO97783.1 nuclear transport factor 2 family protein [Ferrovibrio terrae]